MTVEEVGAFDHLGSAVRAALADRGFATPTRPQRRAIPPIVDGENVLVVAPTGSGKTETAMLPVLDSIVDAEEKFGISALYVTPLRALNRDMLDRLEWWANALELEVDVRHGDTGQYRRQQQAEDPPDILITTPETIQAMLTGSKLRRALEDVDHVIVDEVHELATSKRGAQLAVALERLRDLAGSMQRIGLSATVGEPESVGAFLTGNRSCELVQLDVGSSIDVRVVTPEITGQDERIASELATDARTASHVRVIRDIVDEHSATLIFVNTRQTAEALGSRFTALGANIGIHHGSLSKTARIEVEEEFKAGDLDALLCTSSMELGIDVGHIDHVIQFSSPRQVARLLQRVGRAGHRAETVSAGTIVATSTDDALESIAIVELATNGQVEPARIHDGSLDTLANQIVGMVMGHGEIQASTVYSVISRAAPFAAVDADQFRSVIRELARNRIIWLDEEADRLEKTGGTWQYMYGNLSMIPDEAKYDVYDVASGSQVGTLDEKFVLTFANQGAVFVQRGRMWRIVEIDDEDTTIRVSPIEDPHGEVPSWVGQEIPVPPRVAGRVGSIRRDVATKFRSGTDRESVLEEMHSRQPIDRQTGETALSAIERQIAVDMPIPDAETILIEGSGDELVVNAAFGHKINEALGRMLAALLGQRTGSSVGIEIDPYRIELTVPHEISVTDVADCLRETDPGHVEAIIELSLKRSDVLKFRLAQVAAKFGALKDRPRSSGSVPSGRLLGMFEDTPVYEEAVREVFHEDLDTAGARDVLDRIRAGDVAIEVVGERSPIGTGGRSSGTELLAPEDADASIIETVKERLHSDRVLLACLHCKKWDRHQRVERVKDQPECPNCGSTMIAALNPWADDVLTAVRTAEKDEDQERATQRAYRAASLVQGHGKRAVIALAARGVGPSNAARIINNHRPDDDDFYRDILEREREYARTQAFWD